MKRNTYIGLLSSLCLLLGTVVTPVRAIAVGNNQPTTHVMISELSTGSVGSASDEYVELYNPSDEEVDVSGWELQYRSASRMPDDSTGWSARAIMGCQSSKTTECGVDVLQAVSIGAGEVVRLTSFEDISGALPLKSGMASSGGQVRLVQVNVDGTGLEVETVHDMIGYGTSQTYEGGAPAIAPEAGEAITRIVADEAFVDTDDNKNDFVIAADEDADDGDTTETANNTGGDSNDIETQTATEAEAPKVYYDIEVTEIFPDPESPQLDSTDEFIELYNPYDVAVDLDGYTLKAGATWSHKYIIKNTTIAPHGYIALTSAQTHLTLSNSGSGVRLFDPSGNQLYEVPPYEKARAGESWAREANGSWVWTVRPTPGAANVIETPVEKVKTAASKNTKNSKVAGAKTKATSSKKPQTSSNTVADVGLSAHDDKQDAPGLNMLILIAAGVLAGGYLIYEYRHEIATMCRKIWGKLRAVAGRFGPRKD